jgi:hypothetical protein
MGWEGAAGRMIRESEDLPERLSVYFTDEKAPQADSEDKNKGHPGSIFNRSGIFFCGLNCSSPLIN